MPRAPPRPKTRPEADENDTQPPRTRPVRRGNGRLPLGLVTFDTAQTRQTQLARLTEMVASRPVFLTPLDLAKYPRRNPTPPSPPVPPPREPRPEGKSPAVMVVGLEALLDYREVDPGIPPPSRSSATPTSSATPSRASARFPVVLWLFPTASRDLRPRSPRPLALSLRLVPVSRGRRTGEAKLETAIMSACRCFNPSRPPRTKRPSGSPSCMTFCLSWRMPKTVKLWVNKARRAGLLLRTRHRPMISFSQIRHVAKNLPGRSGRTLSARSATAGARAAPSATWASPTRTSGRRGEGRRALRAGSGIAPARSATAGRGQDRPRQPGPRLRRPRADGEGHRALRAAPWRSPARSATAGARATPSAALGLAYADLGQTEKAIGFLRAGSGDRHREVGDRRGEGSVLLGNLGLAYAALGQTEKADRVTTSRDPGAIAREVGDRRARGILRLAT